jgi:isoleucyl-tRNA synthetase
MSRPADHIITHGLVQDRNGKKMSKSLGNYISPLEIVDRMGADILRLWFASIDYTADFRADLSQLDDAREAYRKLRNTLRFMLGNLDSEDGEGFDAAELTGLDRYIWHRFRKLYRFCVREYSNFEFHRVYRELRNFAVIELSGLYLDVRKDRLYCDGVDSPESRATRRLMAWMTRELIKLLAPVIPFTAEDAWDHLPVGLREGVDSVHLSLFEDVAGETDEERAELEAWEPYLEVRRLAMKELEEARAAGSIGSGLEARVVLTVPEGMTGSARGESWADFLIVSGASVDPGELVTVSVLPAEGSKCQRCWKIMPEVGSASFAGDVCGRCSDVLGGNP